MQTLETSDIVEGIAPEEERFCADCKHLIGVRYKPEIKNWQCGHPNNILKTKTNLITGIKEKIFIRAGYDGLEYLRYKDEIDTCGRVGKWFERYEERSEPPTIGGMQPSEMLSEEDLKKNREAAQRRIEEIKQRKVRKLNESDLTNL